MKIVLVGEAWGRHESQMQHPLVGPSGRELTLELGTAGLAPYLSLLCRKCKRETNFITPRCEHCQEYIWPNEFDLIEHWKKLRTPASKSGTTIKKKEGLAVTNVFNVQPPDNNLGHFFGTEKETEMPAWKASKTLGGSYLKAEYFSHLKRLWNELGDLKPNLVVAMGNAACWATLEQTKITSLRGTVNWSDRLGLKILPVFHPAAVLRQPPMRVTNIADFTKARREAEFPEIRRVERWITILDPDEAGIKAGHDWLTREARAYAVDIETRRGQITHVGMARNPSDAMVIPFRNEDGSSHWPTSSLEIEAWKLIIKALETPTPKIFQNGIYDLSYFIKMGIHPRNCLHDTMLWSHSEYPELPKSLGYLGSIYCSEINWKSMVRHTSLKRDE